MFSNKSFTDKFSRVILSTQIALLIFTYGTDFCKLPKGNLQKSVPLKT